MLIIRSLKIPFKVTQRIMNEKENLRGIGANQQTTKKVGHCDVESK